MTTTALVVDDEVDLCRLMQITLTKMGIKSDVAYDLATAHEYLDKNTYDFCLSDLRLPDGSGLDLVKRISTTTDTPVAVITAHGSMDLAIEALKLGAFDFVNKPLELPRLRQLVENALKVTTPTPEHSDTSDKSPENQLLDERLIGNSLPIQQLKSTITKLARSQAPVFLWGESGTGKEVAARLIHDLSPRREGSFVPVNCGAIPTELMESEFFGHKKGSFTGATTDKLGLFQKASGGTLFLDEVADLPLAMQVKLLRAIQEKTIRPIGDTQEVSVDVRILSATHKDLAQLIQSNDFRQDLFYRINVIELKLPTLNERSEDIPLLAQHFLELIADDWQLDAPLPLTDAACEALKQYDFEGNVRELRNILERAVTLTDLPEIDVKHLGILSGSDSAIVSPSPLLNEHQQTQSSCRHGETSPLSATSQTYCNPQNHSATVVLKGLTTSASVLNNKQPVINSINMQIHDFAPLSPEVSLSANNNTNDNSSVLTQIPFESAIKVSDHTTSPTRPPHDVQLKYSEQLATATIKKEENLACGLPEEGLEAYLQEQEKALIINALNRTGWNKTKAAKLLVTTFRSLRYRMKKLQIDEEYFSK